MTTSQVVYTMVAAMSAVCFVLAYIVRRRQMPGATQVIIIMVATAATFILSVYNVLALGDVVPELPHGRVAQTLLLLWPTVAISIYVWSIWTHHRGHRS